MLEILWWVLVALFLSLGFLGCFVNKIPGPIMVVFAMLVALLGLEIDFGWDVFAVVTGLAIGSIIISKVLVKLVKKLQEFSKRASWGTTIGSIIGLCILAASSEIDNTGIIILLVILGFVVLPFLLAFLLELTAKKGGASALKCATSATCAYLADSFLKLVVFIYAVKVMFFN
ncbi:MAG: DUF456 domain-containing protein [Bacteroidales bacterium]|nr:DUF456 domain-containing protein [Bacteroidales bacterium]